MLKGFVEAIRPFQVRGWAMDTDDLSRRLEVRLLVDDRAVASGIANVYRADLAALEIGDGKHGFVVNAGALLPIDQPKNIAVQVILSDGVFEILPAVEGMAVEPLDISGNAPLPETSISGYFAVLPSEIRGWAFDSKDQACHVEVTIAAGGKIIGKTIADIFREDLVRAGIGTGDHGFVFDLSFQDSRSEISVFVETEDGSNVALGISVPSGDSKNDGKKQMPRLRFRTETSDVRQSPVIVLGAARSGTSAIAQALTRSGAYEGFEEGHFLDIISPLMQASRQFYRNRSEEWSQSRQTHIAAVPEDFVEQGLRHLLVEAVQLTFPSRRWVDKTPRSSMIGLAPILQEIWPNTRFIYMRRRAIENLDSRLRKFAGLDFEALCREWAMSVRTWATVAGNLGGTAVEIDQLYMANNPKEIADTMRGFLDLTDKESEQFLSALMYDQPERTSPRFNEATNLNDLNWSRQQIEIFSRICGQAMIEAGYSPSSEYFLNGDKKYGLVVR